jgi:hypothetical protein
MDDALRGVTCERVVPKTGIGLAIARNLAELDKTGRGDRRLNRVRLTLRRAEAAVHLPYQRSDRRDHVTALRTQPLSILGIASDVRSDEAQDLAPSSAFEYGLQEFSRLIAKLRASGAYTAFISNHFRYRT